MTILLTIITLICAVQALRATSLLVSAAWLAGVSALTAIFIYSLGAPEAAVIELSVGAGLVTVIFVFAISVAGEEAIRAPALLRRPVAWVLGGAAILLLGRLLWPLASADPTTAAAAEASFGVTFWEQRGLDALVQVVLIFAGALTLLSLLGERPEQKETAVQETIATQTPPHGVNGHGIDRRPLTADRDLSPTAPSAVGHRPSEKVAQ
jgi:uncharacterized MnhB-related membrane protein